MLLPEATMHATVRAYNAETQTDAARWKLQGFWTCLSRVVMQQWHQHRARTTLPRTNHAVRLPPTPVTSAWLSEPIAEAVLFTQP